MKVKLIYIAGFARSGTTILGNMLGELDGFVHVGELYRMWRRASQLRDRCGCGEPLEECSLWSQAIPAIASEVHEGRSGEHTSVRDLAARARGEMTFSVNT